MQRHKFCFYSGSIFEVTDWREAVCFDFIVGLFLGATDWRRLCVMIL